MAKNQGPAAHERRILALLDRAIPLEEQVRAKLFHLTKNSKADQALLEEIDDLTNQLQALVIQAENEQARAECPGSSKMFTRRRTVIPVKPRTEDGPRHSPTKRHI